MADKAIEAVLRNLIRVAETRGTDGAGFAVLGRNTLIERTLSGTQALAARFRLEPGARAALINSRLEPTSEFVPHPRTSDLQPYEFDGLTLVHNGLIANDHELKRDFGITPEAVGTTIDSAVLPHVLRRLGGATSDSVKRLATRIVGSYAIAIYDQRQPGRICLACSYKPLWTARSLDLRAVFFASESEQLLEATAGITKAHIERLPPYSGLVIDSNNESESFDLDYRPHGNRTLCVCSGGMDSTTAAAIARVRGDHIVLCHFLYGCKAESREQRAVRQIADYYGTEALFAPLEWLGQLGGSSLTVPEIPIADGNVGVETSHEWVPARNLVMVAHAVALAERFSYGRIVVGLNEQEGEVFPDNEKEFLDSLQMAVRIGSTARIDLEAPLSRMSKRDILRTALELDVPLHLTWSCYRSGSNPCGSCGSCLQRRVAFLQLGKEDFLEYECPLP